MNNISWRTYAYILVKNILSLIWLVYIYIRDN